MGQFGPQQGWRMGKFRSNHFCLHLEQSESLSGSTKMKSIAQDRSLNGSHVVKLEIESINWSKYCIKSS